MNQPLEALMQAWQDLTEERKQAITTAIRREHKFLYKKWIDGIKHGFSPDFFAKRTNAIARDRLDRELFRKGAGDFAKEMLITYFTTTNRQINRLWLESFSTAAQNEPKNSSRELAESCLASLRVQAVDQDLVDLYAATLRYSCPHWFVDEPPDRTAIDESLSRSAPPSSVESGINRAASHTLVEVRDEHSGLLPEAKCQRQCVKTRTNNPPAREKPSAAKKSVLGTPSHARDEEERIRRVVQQESPKLGQRGGDDIQPDRILAVTHSLAEGISSLNFAAAREALRKVRTVFEPINDDIREVEELVRRIGKGINDLKFCQTLPPAVVSSVDVNAALIQSPSAAKISLQRVDTLVTRVEQAFRRWEALIKHVPTAFTTPSLDACVDLDSLAEMMEASCARMEMIIRDHADRLRRFSDFVAHITACEYSAAKRVLLDADSRTYTDSLWLVLNHPATNDLLNDQDTDLDVSAMLGAIKSDIEILSLLIALAWDADSTASMSLLKEAGPSILGDGPEENATLQFIRTADLFRLCQEIPELIPSALSQAVVSSLYSSQQDRMNLALRISQLPGIDPVCRGFCMQMSAHMAVHGVAKTISDMRQELFTGSDYEESRAIARSRVEEAINAPIGQHRNFHRLREIAHELYLFPLLSIVQRGSAKETMERWQADGDCAFKAQHCASKLSGPRKIENQHIINTKRYLESFEEKLRDWCRAVSMPSEDPHTLTLQSETAALVQQSKSNSRCAQHLVRSLKAHCVELADDEGKIICVSFRTDSGGAVGACLKPWRLESWIESSNNAEGDTSTM